MNVCMYLARNCSKSYFKRLVKNKRTRTSFKRSVNFGDLFLRSFLLHFGNDNLFSFTLCTLMIWFDLSRKIVEKFDQVEKEAF